MSLLYRLTQYVFFFSSRRRHTRSLCDWSSDVCSSDLVYVEEGYVYAELGKKDAKLKFQFDNASTVFSNVLRVVQTDSEPWWQSKFMVLQVLFDRGAESDVKLAQVGI